jgi:hypothetical protein
MEMNKESYRFFIETMRRNEMNAQQVHQLLCTAWEEKAPSLATVYRLYGEFSTGSRNSFHDSKRSGRPSSACTPENVDEIDQLIHGDPRITLDELTYETGISHGSVYKIVTVNLQLTSMCSRWIPHALSQDQKHMRIHLAQEWLGEFDKQTSLELAHRIVVTDEKFFYHRSLGRKVSNRTWCIDNEDRQRIPRRTMNDVKSHVICAITFDGKFYYEVLENNQTVNSERYITFLRNMYRKFVHARKPLGWKEMILIQDNARPHVSRMTTDFLASKKVLTFKQPPYSPDYNLCDRWLFGKLEQQRKTQNFQGVTELNHFLQEELNSLDEEALFKQLEYLKQDLSKIIYARGNYL